MTISKEIARIIAYPRASQDVYSQSRKWLLPRVQWSVIRVLTLAHSVVFVTAVGAVHGAIALVLDVGASAITTDETGVAVANR